MFAAWVGAVDVVETLLHFDADPAVEDYRGRTAIAYAAMYCNACYEEGTAEFEEFEDIEEGHE